MTGDSVCVTETALKINKNNVLKTAINNVIHSFEMNEKRETH